MPQPRRHLLAAHLAEVRQLSAQGCSERTIAKALGMSYGAWRRALDADPRTQAALAEGRAVEHDALVGSLFKAATEKGNVIAAIFLLKARHGYRDTADVTPVNQVAVVFQMPAPLTPDQYQRVLAATPPKVLAEAGGQE